MRVLSTRERGRDSAGIKRDATPFISVCNESRLWHGSQQKRQAVGNPTCGLIFPNSLGRPMNFDTLAFEVIKPALRRAGIQWHGWHAFRRGLATNLYRLGVKDKVIQAILRRSNLSTTMNTYVKSVSLDATSAMGTLEAIYATSM